MAASVLETHSSEEDIKLLHNQACEAAEKFVKLYYESFDKRNHVISKLYDDNASLVWDGNAVVGKEAILKFHENLPSSVHTVDSIDAQNIPSFVTSGQNTMLVKTNGSVRYDKNKLKIFSQVFLLMAAQTSTWKITSDTLRLS